MTDFEDTDPEREFYRRRDEARRLASGVLSVDELTEEHIGRTLKVRSIPGLPAMTLVLGDLPRQHEDNPRLWTLPRPDEKEWTIAIIVRSTAHIELVKN